jgi:hypothetical protein
MTKCKMVRCSAVRAKFRNSFVLFGELMAVYDATWFSFPLSMPIYCSFVSLEGSRHSRQGALALDAKDIPRMSLSKSPNKLPLQKKAFPSSLSCLLYPSGSFHSRGRLMKRGSQHRRCLQHLYSWTESGRRVRSYGVMEVHTCPLVMAFGKSVSRSDEAATFRQRLAYTLYTRDTHQDSGLQYR